MATTPRTDTDTTTANAKRRWTGSGLEYAPLFLVIVLVAGRLRELYRMATDGVLTTLLDAQLASPRVDLA